MSSIRSVLSIRLLNGNDPSRRREGERVWGGNYQGLLKRVGASLENLEILEKRKTRKEGTGQVYEEEQAMARKEIRRGFSYR